MKRVEHPNYCRQIVKQVRYHMSIPNWMKQRHNASKAVAQVDLCNSAKKFILPDNGILIDDPACRALDVGELPRLPFPVVALEFNFVAAIPKPWKQPTVVFARQWEESDGVPGSIVISLAFKEAEGNWSVTSSATPYCTLVEKADPSEGLYKSWVSPNTGKWEEEGVDALRHSCEVVMGFLNALACSNVRVERVDPSKQPKLKKGKVADPLPFDAYHYLTIDVGRQPGEAGPGLLTTHRSPREHIRRGHIRRYESGLKVWVNSHVVGAGKGAGKITKDYNIINSQLEAT